MRVHITILSSCLFSLCFAHLITTNPIVTIEDGTVIGHVKDSAVVWLGIPFAAPPVGDGRWAPPKSPKPFGTIIASEYSPACPQTCNTLPKFCPKKTDEDCLYLNVYSPLIRDPDVLMPVMVFLHGGSFSSGEASLFLYDGDTNVNRSSTLLVTLNYRLGPLGFLSTENIPGNFGIQDQLKALQWIRDNIVKFGGNFEQITLFGESAGAISVGLHLTSERSRGLFHRAILQSNPVSLLHKTREQAETFGRNFLKKVNCKTSDLSCLRSLSVDDIVRIGGERPSTNVLTFSLQELLPWGPVIDNDYVPMQLLPAVTQGKIQKVPVILGSNTGEGVFFVYPLLTTPLNDFYLGAILVTIWGAKNLLTIHDTYDIRPNLLDLKKDNRLLLSQMITDYVFVCPTRQMAQSLSNYNHHTYLYSFDHAISFDEYGPAYNACNSHACHASELGFVFDIPNRDGFTMATSQEKILATQMMTYWTGFAKSSDGSPNQISHMSVFRQAFLK
ncbi:butyrylcholinesterase-like [Planoprotostelium fungivorum]|uniref:Carboxylic ester hydrolase n=1 Tax=Planoprotostelium fungivorum TaxID=1890364 RepID=A0A2P6N6F1_9EUKA|nr:butyrylcholinesterase-like [Planoprotostelium fungivorum]